MLHLLVNHVDPKDVADRGVATHNVAATNYLNQV